jgi:hypothetical protein
MVKNIYIREDKRDIIPVLIVGVATIGLGIALIAVLAKAAK